MWKRGLLALGAALTLGAGKPLAISLTPSSATITEGQSVALLLGKSGGNGRVSTARVTTSDGSWSGTVALGASFTVPTKDDTLVNGTRTITVTATASTGVTAKSVITIQDNDVAPPPPPTVTWTKCADEGGVCYIKEGTTARVRYGFGTTWSDAKQVTGYVECSNSWFGDPLVGTAKICQMDGTPGTPPAPPPPPSGNWVSAPLRGGNYARVTMPTTPIYPDAIGAYRPVTAGEIFALYVNGEGVSADGRRVLAGYSLSKLDTVYIAAEQLEGIAPTPGYVPSVKLDDRAIGLAKLSCTDAYSRAGMPGITAGKRYYVRLVAGSTMPPPWWPGPIGQDAGAPPVNAVPVEDPYQAPMAVVPSSCFTAG